MATMTTSKRIYQPALLGATALIAASAAIGAAAGSQSAGNRHASALAQTVVQPPVHARLTAWVEDAGEATADTVAKHPVVVGTGVLVAGGTAVLVWPRGAPGDPVGTVIPMVNTSPLCLETRLETAGSDLASLQRLANDLRTHLAETPGDKAASFVLGLSESKIAEVVELTSSGVGQAVLKIRV